MSGQRLPGVVVDLWLAVEHLPHPAAAIAVRNVVFDALEAANQRATFNLGMRRLKKRRATCLSVLEWLSDPVVDAALWDGGAYWALSRWRHVLTCLGESAKTRGLFDMSAPGSRHSQSFSEHDNLAAYVQNRVRNGEAAGVVLKEARAVMKARMPDDRIVRWARAKLAALSDADLAEMALVAKSQLGLP